jgi:hypothetical protein
MLKLTFFRGVSFISDNQPAIGCLDLKLAYTFGYLNANELINKHCNK